MSETILEPMQELPESKRPVPWKRWLLAFDWYNFLTNTLFSNAIWVIYLAVHGYSPLAIGLFEMLFHVAKFVAEVPTGIFADMLGRRKSLIVYCVLGAVHMLLFLMPTVPFIAISFVLAGIAFAFRGGANEALLWTLSGYAEPQQAEQQTKRYSRLVSRMFMVGMVAEVIGTASGGYLGHILQVLPFMCSTIAMLLAIIPLLMIPEQQVAGDIEEHTSALLHLGKGLRAVWQTPTLLGLLLIGALTDSCWQTIYYYYQLYLHGLGFSLSIIGVAVAGSMLSGFVFTGLAPTVMHHLAERWLVPICVLLEIVGLFFMSLPQPVLSLLGYLIPFQAAISLLAPSLSTYINQRSPEAQRATVLSLQTGLFSAAMIVLFPLFGLGVSHASYSTIYLWTLIALALGSLAIGGGVWLLHTMKR